MEELDISLVVYKPRWEELAETLNCLSEVADEYRVLRILLSGNARDRLRLNNLMRDIGFSGVDLVVRADNLGFAGGHNMLMVRSFRAGATWNLIYNPDIQVDRNSIQDLVKYAQRLWSEANPPSLYGPVLYAADGRQIDSAGIKWSADGRHSDISSKSASPPGHGAAVEGLTGACLLVRDTVHEKIVDATGFFFDPLFVAYREDAELGVRARLVGVQSTCIACDGFLHSRGIQSSSRRNQLVNMLSVQNRFLMRWSLGPARPGRYGLATLRDIGVLFAVLTVERSSWPGLRRAWHMRRYAKYCGRWYRSRVFPDLRRSFDDRPA